MNPLGKSIAPFFYQAGRQAGRQAPMDRLDYPPAVVNQVEVRTFPPPSHDADFPQGEKTGIGLDVCRFSCKSSS